MVGVGASDIFENFGILTLKFLPKITQNRPKSQKWSKSRKISFRVRPLMDMYCPSIGFLRIYQPFLGCLAHFLPVFALPECLWGSLRAFCDTFRWRIFPELAKMSKSAKIGQYRFSSLVFSLYWLLQIMVFDHFSTDLKEFGTLKRFFYPS